MDWRLAVVVSGVLLTTSRYNAALAQPASTQAGQASPSVPSEASGSRPTRKRGGSPPDLQLVRRFQAELAAVRTMGGALNLRDLALLYCARTRTQCSFTKAALTKAQEGFPDEFERRRRAQSLERELRARSEALARLSVIAFGYEGAFASSALGEYDFGAQAFPIECGRGAPVDVPSDGLLPHDVGTRLVDARTFTRIPMSESEGKRLLKEMGHGSSCLFIADVVAAGTERNRGEVVGVIRVRPRWFAAFDDRMGAGVIFDGKTAAMTFGGKRVPQTASQTPAGQTANGPCSAGVPCGGATASTESADEYGTRLVSAVRQRFEVPPGLSERERSFLSATVALFIEPDGRVARLTFERRSGNPMFDGALEEAVRASRVPPPPPHLRELYARTGVLVNFRTD